MLEGRLSVLAVTSQLPWPLNTGGHLRTFHLLRALAKRFKVCLIAGAAGANEEGTTALGREGVKVLPVPLGPRRYWREVLRALGAALRGEPYVLYQRHNRTAIRRALRAATRQEAPDLVYLDHLDSCALFPRGSSFTLALDLHNVYSLLVRREADGRARPTRWYLQREARLLAKAEKRAALLAEVLFSVSETEAAYFRGLGARFVRVVPNGVDCAAYESLPTGRSGGPEAILYVGTMSWAPNAAAARFLANQVLPQIRQHIPTAELWIVGKDPPPDLVALGDRPGLRVTGGVPSMVPFLREARALAVPLEAGGGTRLKILEAFAAGLPVVSTAVGCEGIRCVDGQHLLVRERGEFASALVALLAAPKSCETLAIAARQLARDLYDWEVVGKLACDAIDVVTRAQLQ